MGQRRRYPSVTGGGLEWAQRGPRRRPPFWRFNAGPACCSGHENNAMQTANVGKVTPRRRVAPGDTTAANNNVILWNGQEGNAFGTGTGVASKGDHHTDVQATSLTICCVLLLVCCTSCCTLRYSRSTYYLGSTAITPLYHPCSYNVMYNRRHTYTSFVHACFCCDTSEL